MINAIANGLSNSTFYHLTQNTAARVSIETTLKSIGRPGFILIDDDIDDETKKYAATKEFFYQAICLAVYLAVIPPIFKAGSYKIGKKIFGKEHPEFAKFKNMKEYLDYHKFAKKVYNDRLASLKKVKSNKKFMHDGLRDDLLNKEELISEISKKAKVSKKDAGMILSATIDTIEKSVKKGNKVTLVGFGTFDLRHRKARTGRNPQTGKAIKIAAKKVPTFSAGKSFKELVK